MRRFEFSAGGSDKFWEIELEENGFAVCFGRIGTKGQTQSKQFATEEKARAEAEKAIQEKLKKGYVEVDLEKDAAPHVARTRENLIANLQAAGIDISSFQKIDLSGDEDDNTGRRDASNSFYMIEAPAKDVLNTWQKARSLVDKTGYYPIISENWDELLESLEFEDDFDPATSIKEALAVDIPALFKERLEEVERAENEGDWPDGDVAAGSEFYVISGAGADSTLPIIFCPTKLSWQIYPLLCWAGAVNYDIAPSCHAAVQKYWAAEYETELVCMTRDILEFTVAKPPTSRDAAMKLAREQFGYCPDIVDQGVGTIANLGKGLIGSNIWYFWWD